MKNEKKHIRFGITVLEIVIWGRIADTDCIRNSCYRIDR